MDKCKCQNCPLLVPAGYMVPGCGGGTRAREVLGAAEGAIVQELTSAVLAFYFGNPAPPLARRRSVKPLDTLSHRPLLAHDMRIPYYHATLAQYVTMYHIITRPYRNTLRYIILPRDPSVLRYNMT